MNNTKKSLLKNHPEFAELLRKKAKIRFWFSMTVWTLYGGFALGYSFLQDLFATRIAADSQVPFALVYFFALIVIFIALEYLYMRIADGLQKRASQYPSEEVVHYAD